MTHQKLRTIKHVVLAMTLCTVAVFNLTDSEAGNEQANLSNNKLVWLDNYDAALKEAKATGKPIFLEFRCAP